MFHDIVDFGEILIDEDRFFTISCVFYKICMPKAIQNFNMNYHFGVLSCSRRED